MLNISNIKTVAEKEIKKFLEGIIFTNDYIINNVENIEIIEKSIKVIYSDEYQEDVFTMNIIISINCYKINNFDEEKIFDNIKGYVELFETKNKPFFNSEESNELTVCKIDLN